MLDVNQAPFLKGRVCPCPVLCVSTFGVNG